jgi:hypothetical protein
VRAARHVLKPRRKKLPSAWSLTDDRTGALDPDRRVR